MKTGRPECEGHRANWCSAKTTIKPGAQFTRYIFIQLYIVMNIETKCYKYCKNTGKKLLNIYL